MNEPLEKHTFRDARPLIHRDILGMRVDATSYPEATSLVIDWARREVPRYVCVGNVNNVMYSRRDPSYLELMNRADLVTADGVPLVWGLKLLGAGKAVRVYGPELTRWVLDAAESRGIPVGFYGASADTMAKLLGRVRSRWPRLEIAYSHSPPFRSLSREEDDEVVRAINDSGAKILFVGLGCPKQEIWMAGHAARLKSVMLGVGAAFDFLAGTKPQAPSAMQRAGLEWLFRLASEPRRLWRRYLLNNPLFVVLFGAQVLRDRRRRRAEDNVDRRAV
ncbi:MAG: WecB/TagA/CpsF family glycosyltransferase [Actinomycetota bacterium]